MKPRTAAVKKSVTKLTPHVDAMFDLLEPLSSEDRALVIVVAAKWLCSPEQLEKADADVRDVISRSLLGGGDESASVAPKKSRKRA